MELSFNQRVKYIMKNEGFEDNPKAFADFLGMNRPDVLYNVLKSDTGFSRTLFEFITKKLPQIDPKWIERGKGEKPYLTSNEKIQTSLTITFDSSEVKRIIFENSDLHKKLEGILQERLDKSEEINDVFRERDKLKKENITLKKKIK